MDHTLVTKNLEVVFGRLIEMSNEDEDFLGCLAEQIEALLDIIHEAGEFGSEGQCDPRGDFRNGSWSIFNEIEPQ